MVDTDESGSGVKVVAGALLLAIEPDQWVVDLADGGRLIVLAHAWCEEGDDTVYSLLFDGKPAYEVESLRIPTRLLGLPAFKSLPVDG